MGLQAVTQDQLMHLVPFSVSCWDVSTNDAVKRGLLVISEIPWQMGEVPECWKKGNVSPIIRKGKKGGSRELQTCEPGADRPWEGDGWVEVARMDLQREPSLTNLRDTSRELVDVGAPSWKAALRDGPGCWADRGPEARPCGRGGHQLKSRLRPAGLLPALCSALVTQAGSFGSCWAPRSEEGVGKLHQVQQGVAGVVQS